MENIVNMYVLNACDVLSGYNWFKIKSENTEDGTQVFYATRLEPQFEGEIIKAERQFATPVYMAGFDRVTATSDNCIVFHLPNGGSYTVEGLEKDFSDPNQYNNRKKAYKAVSDLAEVDFINPEWTQYDKNNDTVVLVVDPFRMGLTNYAEEQIKHIININLNGQGSKKQIFRTVCFKVKVNDPYRKIFADVYDLEKNQPTNWAAPHFMEFNTNLAVSMKAAEIEKI